MRQIQEKEPKMCTILAIRAGIMIGEEQAISDVKQRETSREIKAGVLRSTDGTRAREPFWGRQRQSSAPVGYGPC